MTEYQIYTLPNGIRIAHRQVAHTKIVHCGIMLDIGSRDEQPHQSGLVHFWEHMAFKGTKKRKSYHIINRLESVGGELNAYTTKEKVCFYASALDIHFDKTVELLTDITFNSVFPENQIEKERSVILEEMSMYEDSPEDAIQDEFDEYVFSDHQLGVNILGTREHVKSFTKKDLQEFIAQNMDTSKIVISIVGNISFKKAIQRVEKYVADIPFKSVDYKRVEPFEYQTKHTSFEKQTVQAHCALGRRSLSIKDESRLAFFTLINLLGGPGMNSRFNLSLREKYGLVYGIDANFTSYTDTGFLGIYFATDPANLEKAIKLIYREMKLLREKPLGEVQLRNVKEQLMGQLAMSEESNQGYMLSMARSILDLGYVQPLQQIFDDIRNITSADLQNLANQYLNKEEFSSLIYKPVLN
jgi:predicted Zn-dependent peptidase